MEPVLWRELLKFVKITVTLRLKVYIGTVSRQFCPRTYGK